MRRNAATVGAATATRRTSNGGSTMGPSLMWTKWPFVSTATPQPSAAPRPRSQASRAIAVTRTDVANDIGGSKAWGGQENSSAAPTRGSDTVIHILNDDGNVAPSCSKVEGEQGYTHAATPSHQPWMVEGDALHTTEEGVLSQMNCQKDGNPTSFLPTEIDALKVVTNDTVMTASTPPVPTRGHDDDDTAAADLARDQHRAELIPERDLQQPMTSAHRNDGFCHAAHRLLDRSQALLIAEGICDELRIPVEVSCDSSLRDDIMALKATLGNFWKLDESELRDLRKQTLQRCSTVYSRLNSRLDRLLSTLEDELDDRYACLVEARSAICDSIDGHMTPSTGPDCSRYLQVTRLARTAYAQFISDYILLDSTSCRIDRLVFETDARTDEDERQGADLIRSLLHDVDTKITVLSRLVEGGFAHPDRTPTVGDHEVDIEGELLKAGLENEAASHFLSAGVEGDDTQAPSPSPLEEVEGDAKEDTVSVPVELGSDAYSFGDTLVTTDESNPKADMPVTLVSSPNPNAGVVEGHESHTNDEAVHGQTAYEVDSTDGTMSQSILDEVEGDIKAEEIVRLENSVRSRDDKIVDLQATVTRLQGDLESLRHDVTSTTTQRDALKSQLESRDEDVARLQEEVTRLLDDLASAKAMIVQTPTEGIPSDGAPLQVVFDGEIQVAKLVTDDLHGASWASICEEDEAKGAEDTASRDIARTCPLGAWSVSPQITGVGDAPALPTQVSPIRSASSNESDNDTSLRRDKRCRDDSKVRILRRPGAPTSTARATTDTPRLQDYGLELCVPSRSVVDKSMRNVSRRRKGTSTDNTPRHKNGVTPVSRGALISRQQANWAVQACHIISAQLERDRTFFHEEVGQLRLLVAELIQQRTGHSNDELFTEKKVLETIPEESAVLSTGAIVSTITDGRCTSVEDSSDTQRKCIGFPSEIVRPMDSPGTGLVSPSARDDRVATDVLSGDGSPLRQVLTEVEQSTDGDPAQNDEDGEDGIDGKGTAFVEQATPPTDDMALLSPMAVEGDADSSNGTAFDQAAPPTDVTVLHSHSMVEGDTKRWGDDIHRSTLQGDNESDDALQSIGLSTSNFNGNFDENDATPSQLREDDVSPITQRNDVHPLKSVFAAPVLAFQLAPASSDDILRQIDTNNRLESQDDGLPPKPKRKRRRNRRRRRKRGRKKTTHDLLIHSPMTHPQEFRTVFNSAATKSLPLSGFDGPGDTSKLTYTTSRQPDPSNNATRSKFPTIKNADKSFPSASPLDISRARNDTVSCTLSSFVHDLEAELDAAILGFV